MRKDHRHYIICDDTRKVCINIVKVPVIHPSLLAKLFGHSYLLPHMLVCQFCKETIEAPDPAERTDVKDVDPDEDAAEAPHRRQASHFGGAAAAR